MKKIPKQSLSNLFLKLLGGMFGIPIILTKLLERKISQRIE
ncbi:hypothetical protein NTE_02565 [Candidatus Nitrososphaera evergladensis SR1]|uniref:Uncharacterized protein n=1 Tax=Candidatus Nitrososphaera evergladensis SR1 TaxID=1459636 RepID=A0A075MZD6_9ARCH|nr:hypothetical protein NTE_02565 [Candidatus Nitrososphaera evergladensis SR1]